MPKTTHLNVFPLGSYSMLLGIDWLYLHKTKVDCFDKAIECVDEKEEFAGEEESYISENGYRYVG